MDNSAIIGERTLAVVGEEGGGVFGKNPDNLVKEPMRQPEHAENAGVGVFPDIGENGVKRQGASALG